MFSAYDRLTDRFMTSDIGYQQNIIFRPGKRKNKAEAFTSRCSIFYSSNSTQATTNLLRPTYLLYMPNARVQPCVNRWQINLPTCCKCFTWNTGRPVFYFKITLSMKTQLKHACWECDQQSSADLCWEAKANSSRYYNNGCFDRRFGPVRCGHWDDGVDPWRFYWTKPWGQRWSRAPSKQVQTSNCST